MAGLGSSTTRGSGNRFWPITIRAKVFFAFALVALIIGVVGLYAAMGMHEAGRMVVRTFDMPLMSISHARLARSHFTELRYLMLRRQIAAPGADAAALAEAIQERVGDLKQDIDIAGRRSLSPEGRQSARKLQAQVAAWHAAFERESRNAAPDWAALDAMAEWIDREFNVLAQIAAGDAFHWRQTAIATTQTNERLQIAAVAAALLLALIITVLLSRRIVRPIKAASAAAERIAGGELQTPIPKAGHDETGALLAAMTVMQDNLRAMMAREVAEKRSAQRRLVDAIETARSGIVLVDNDGVVLLANSQAAQMFPNAAAHLSPGARFDAFLAAAREADVAPRSAGGDSLTAPEAEVMMADGRWIRMARAMVGEGDVVMVWTDISILKDREANLVAAKEEAEAADRAKTNFLTNMSHELRTPLNAVIGFSEMIASEILGPVGKPQYRSYAQDILSSGRHLLAVINDILDIAKSAAGTLQIDPRPIAAHDLFKECATIVSHQFGKAKLTFDLRMPPPHVSVHADPVKARQILINLLSNAMKFTPSGGRVSMYAEAQGADFVDIVVADTGIGMRPEDIPIALAPFGQIDNRLERKYDGTGLGLPLTKILTELHGGELSISSRPGAGTVVRVRLPSHPPRGASAPGRVLEAA
jgi:signal transduction histidine kinase